MEQRPAPVVPPDPLLLVVDDEPANVDFLCHVMQREFPDARLVTARNGHEALEKIAESLPDLIMLDLAMPGLDGYGVLEALQEREATRLIPVIVLTSYGLQDTQLDAIAAGADDFLPKPFRGMEVVSRARALLRVRFRYRALSDQLERLQQENHKLRACLEDAVGIEDARQLLAQR